MARLSETFVTEEAPDIEFEPLPVGTYVAQVEKAELRTTSAGTGEYISIRWKILEADNERYVGRTVFQNINIVNPSEMAVKIGKGQLKQIAKAMGLSAITDTDELLGTPVRIVLKIRPPQNGYDATNEVKKVLPVSGEESVPSSADDDEIPF